MSPAPFLARIASIVAPPRFPLLRLHGVFGARQRLADGARVQTSTLRRIDARARTQPAVLTVRIAARVAQWLAHGWLDEVRGLLDAGYGGARAMASVGYAEVRAHLDGKLPREELRDAIVRSTRVFARRQRTWLNHASVEWL